MSNKRPSIQLYPADLRSSNKLSQCTWEERGVWMWLIFFFHDSDEYGILRWSLEEMASSIGCNIEILYSLIRKGVLKGADKGGDKVSFSSSFAQRQGAAINVTLINNEIGPFWYSSRMVRDEYIRNKKASAGANHTKISNDKGGDKPPIAPTIPIGSSTSSSTSPSDYEDTTNVVSFALSPKVVQQEDLIPEEIVMIFPVKGKHKPGEKYQVTADMIEGFQALYPAVDVMQEIRNMAGWLIANPTKQKTMTGMLKFINNWLAKRQNQGGGIQNVQQSPQGFQRRGGPSKTENWYKGMWETHDRAVARDEAERARKKN